MNHSQIYLKTSTILNVPFQYYGEDFLFIVNGKEFHTKRLIADLLSKKICHIHYTDPTVDKYIINTESEGDFSHILNLVKFTHNDVPENEVPFLIEIVNKLENDSIEITEQKETRKITMDNAIDLLQKHEQNSSIYSKNYQNEIEFISSHFHKITESEKEKLSKLKISTLLEIFTNKKLKLKSEDQLFEIINKLYSKNSEYSILYEIVDFLNLSAESMHEFTSKFDINDLTHGIWEQICERLNQTEKRIQNNKSMDRFAFKSFEYSENKPFSGILNYLMQQNKGKISDEINLTASSYFSQNEKYQIQNITSFEEENNGFATNSIEGSWICVDFKDKRIIPTYYSIKIIGSYFYGSSYCLKNWAIETSNDNKEWEVIDEVSNYSEFGGSLSTRTFKIEKQPKNEIKYIRIRLTGKDSLGTYYLGLNSFEIFGHLI